MGPLKFRYMLELCKARLLKAGLFLIKHALMAKGLDIQLFTKLIQTF